MISSGMYLSEHDLIVFTSLLLLLVTAILKAINLFVEKALFGTITVLSHKIGGTPVSSGP